MAMQWADDFSRYGTTGSREAMLSGLPYANLGGNVVASPDPNDSGRAFRINSGNNDWPLDMRIALPTVVTGKLGVCLRAWLSSLPGDDFQRCAVAGFQRVDGSYLVYARIEQNGAISIQARVAGVLTEVANTVNPIVQPSSFNHYELVHDTTTGEGQLYINGVLRISYDGVDTGVTMVFVNCSNRSASVTSVPFYVKDLVIWDGTGTRNNDVMGTVLVGRYKPNTDEDLGGWVPSTGTSAFALLAKDTPNDATYISAAGTPLPSPVKMGLENLPDDVTSVRGILTVHRTRKVDGGDANIQTALSPDNVAWDNGADRPMTSAFSYYFDVSELDPDTGVPWTPIDFDGALVRIDRTV